MSNQNQSTAVYVIIGYEGEYPVVAVPLNKRGVWGHDNLGDHDD